MVTMVTSDDDFFDGLDDDVLIDGLYDIDGLDDGTIVDAPRTTVEVMVTM